MTSPNKAKSKWCIHSGEKDKIYLLHKTHYNLWTYKAKYDHTSESTWKM